MQTKSTVSLEGGEHHLYPLHGQPGEESPGFPLLSMLREGEFLVGGTLLIALLDTKFILGEKAILQPWKTCLTWMNL